MVVINTPKWIMRWGYGLTLYKLVFLRSDLTGYNRDYVMYHEECHVHQWTTEGFFRFPYLYLKELSTNGYYDNKYEIEARKYGKIKANKMRKACCGSND